MKKLVSLILAIGMVLSFAACGSSSTQKSEPLDEPAPTSTGGSTEGAEKSPESPMEDAVLPADAEPPLVGGGGPAEMEKESPPTGGGDRVDAEDYDIEPYPRESIPPYNTEDYDPSEETPFMAVATNPLSTFSVDVDTASYSNMRRQILNGQRPQGVRIEELVNYFDYDYPNPRESGKAPFSVTAQISAAPWNSQHQLAMIGIQGETVEQTKDIKNNLVFLIDVSGSMSDSNKLPLLQEAMVLMIENLNGNDIVSIVTYSGEEKIIADSVLGNDYRTLTGLIRGLNAGGSTAGKQAMETAYRLAEKNFIEGGNNRIIMCTDGDFNVGETTVGSLTEFVEYKRESGVYISVLGFGMYNLKDYMMESIADQGNGNYYYIDTLEEAKKILVDEFDSLMYPIAKDVKLQVEFNPAVVKEYRLIGYDNRMLATEDFDDDTKDAGEIGSGHNITAFYELVLWEEGEEPEDSKLTYQQNFSTGSSDYMTINVRYKKIDTDKSDLVSYTVPWSAFTNSPNKDFVFAASVVEFGLILKDSPYKGDASTNQVIKKASASYGEDALRKEFVQLVQKYQHSFE